MQTLNRDLAIVAGIDVVPRILQLACAATGMRFAAVARVTSERWIACSVQDDLAFGLAPGGELRVETTMCGQIFQHHQAVVIPCVSEDPRFREHSIATLYGLDSYLSVPIFRHGEFFGTLCAIDTRPARSDLADAARTFELFAQLIGFHLETADCLEQSVQALRVEQERAHLREQFMAVLGHDLRSPLASIGVGVQALQHRVEDLRSQAVLKVMGRSVQRMSDLIGDVLDLARSRLGNGLAVVKDADAPLAPFLEQVIAEVRSAAPGAVIDADLRIDVPIACDRARMAQLLSNLLANALTHGSPVEPIQVRAVVAGDTLLLWVANRGTPIDPAVMPRLFQPFFRPAGAARGGLGLGLFIVAQIAMAHGGAVAVDSTAEETRFTVRIPVA
ncbi:GAF domain-containing sensor histidine kinase [Verticiella sediminum]|uniref:histidine kinase n=2 Tax=Verticiella sediminum TaxID=1247510 RepID=A0A556AX03_9BURK|nr:GAF domain-containing sensor histidine kinase [Verticiella sediminum]